MWTIHRVESVDGDLTVYARSLAGGGKFPRWATGEALAKVATVVPCGTSRRGTVRSLTDDETARERREIIGCEATLDTICRTANRRAVDAMTAEMRLCNETIIYAAIDFPGAGWRGDSTAYVYIPVGE